MVGDLFDTHLHLDEGEDAAGLFAAARERGVTRFLVVGTGISDSRRALGVAGAEPGVVAAVGLHPHDARLFDGLGPFRECLSRPGAVAVGEIGLDYHYDHSSRSDQRRVFRAFLDLAAELGLPAVIHCREAFEDCLPMLEDWHAPGCRFELHSFTGTPAEAEKALALGAMISFNGIVTFPKANDVRQSLAVVPMDRLLLETDAPYLAPVPHRGRRNVPAYLVDVARGVAAARDLPVEELVRRTTANACRFFGLGPVA